MLCCNHSKKTNKQKNSLPQEWLLCLSAILMLSNSHLSLFIILACHSHPTKWWRTKNQKQSHNWVGIKKTIMSWMNHWQYRSLLTYGTILFLAILSSISVNSTIIHIVAQNPKSHCWLLSSHIQPSNHKQVQLLFIISRAVTTSQAITTMYHTTTIVYTPAALFMLFVSAVSPYCFT